MTAKDNAEDKLGEQEMRQGKIERRTGRRGVIRHRVGLDIEEGMDKQTKTFAEVNSCCDAPNHVTSA